MLASIACLTRAAALILALSLSLVAMNGPAAAEMLGRWQTFNGPGFTFTFDVQVQSGSPGGMRTLSGEITPTGTFDADCGRARPGDRFHLYVCERLSKDGPFALDANMSTARGQPVLTGADINSGATLELTLEEGTAAPLAKLLITLERFDGATDTMTLVARKRDVRTAPQALVGNWIGADGGLTLETRIEAVDDDRVAVTVSAFADRALPVPSSRPLDEWHRIAGSERAFSMSATAARQPDQPHAFWTTVLTREGEFPDRIGAGAELKPTPSGNLQIVFTGAGLGGVPPVYVTFARADRPLRQVAPTRSAPDMMNGQWIGNVGPLVIEADIEMNGEGEATATFHAFDDQAKGSFPRNPSRAFIWFHEVVEKRQPFALSFEGSWDGRAGFVAGRGESVKTKDFGIDANMRIRRVAVDELSLSAAHPTDDVFDGQPIRLVRRATPLRPVPSFDGAEAKPAVESPLAGSWVWSSGPNRRGNVILLELAGDDLGPISGAIKVWNTDGTCETFPRTQALCELGRDDGPLANAVRLDPTGDDRWPYDALEGLRAFGKDFPAYSDLRMRLRPSGTGTLMVQMTAAAAFGAQPDNTYLFEKLGASETLLAPSLDDRAYVARPDDPAPGACEAWARDDSLRRQKNLPALTARLDAILANQKIGASGHPLDDQCKQMLDDMAEAGLDPAKDDGGMGSGSAGPKPQDPVAAGPVVGTWRMVGQPHESLPAMGIWQTAAALRPTLSGFEMSGQSGQYSAVETNGPFVSTFATLNADIEQFRSHLEKPMPGTGAASLMEWIGTPEALLAGGGGTRLGWVDEQNVLGDETVLLVAGDRALLFTDGPRLAGSMMDFATIGQPPRNVVVAAFERTRTDAPDPKPQEAAGSTGDFKVRNYRQVASYGKAFGVMDDLVARLTVFGDRIEMRPVRAGKVVNTDERHVDVGRGTLDSVLGAYAPDDFTVRHQTIPDVFPELAGQSFRDFVGGEAKAYSYTPPGAVVLETERMLFLSRDGNRFLEIERFPTHSPGHDIWLGARTTSSGPMPDPVPGPDPKPAADNRDVANTDPVNIPVPPKPEPNAVCESLERRTAEMNAEAGSELVQAIRSIYADVGLAFGGEQTEAKCQRALDRLNAIVLVPDTRNNGQSGQTGGGPRQGNVYLVDNSVNVFNTFVDNGGNWSAPDAPDPCATLDAFAATLTFSGGMGMGGFIDGLFVEVGLSLSGQRRPDLCYDAMLHLWDYGVDPALDDGGWGVVRVLIDVDGQLRRPGRDPAESRACRAYTAFTSKLLAKGGTEMVQFLRGYAIDQGFGMGSTRDPSPADCARMLAELRDLGLDPDLPDGGFSFASDFLPAEPVPSPARADRAVAYDARPEPEIELANWLSGAPYTYAVPMTGELQQIGELAGVVAFVTPPEGLLGGDHARPGDRTACMDRRRLTRDESFRAWAAMRELMRHFVPPGSILSGRDCVLVEVATEMAFATMGDPSFAHGEDEFVSVILDRRLDGVGLGADDRQIAGRTVGAMLREPEPTETHPWRAVVTTPDIVAAVTGYVVPAGSFLVWNHRTGGVAGPFRMRLSGEAR
ncbi:hypothetical protein EJC49_14285 [Aquibium carbonis]|uniref:Uncharacterized protein n=1 Tax=Aquibium carbonis TaxID=2495581 RepID=A0A3S0ARZ6_9HYPH|nr:hypothetical protein [Aquibium carbonis]RST85704.1 hypothetical protein EJC49_14285 [Aquibium carbonis]